MCKKAKQFKSFEEVLDRACGWGDLPEEEFIVCKNGDIAWVDEDGNVLDVTLPPAL